MASLHLRARGRLPSFGRPLTKDRRRTEEADPTASSARWQAARRRAVASCYPPCERGAATLLDDLLAPPPKAPHLGGVRLGLGLMVDEENPQR